MAEPNSKADLNAALDEALPDDEEVDKETSEEEKEEETSDDEEVSDEDGKVEEEEEETKSDKDDEESEETKDDTDKPKIPSLATRAKQKFPGLFKEFPEIKEAIYKHHEFQQIFGSVDDAREAAAKVEVMDNLTNNLLEGNVEPLLDSLYEEDPEALKSMALSFLPTLHKKSSKLFSMVATPIIANMFHKIAKMAVDNDNEDLFTAVRYCTKAIGLGTDIPKPMRMGAPERNKEIDSERQSLNEERETHFYDNVESMANPTIDAEILKGLDPENALPEGLREAAIEKIKREVLLTLKGNQSHMRMMMALRKSAAANDYSKEHQKKIARTVIKAAKEVIPSVRNKVKKRMLGNLVKSDKEHTPPVPNSDGSTHNVGGEDKGGKFNPDKIDWNKTSMRDVLDKVLP